jgi:hypothetical protein
LGGNLPEGTPFIFDVDGSSTQKIVGGENTGVDELTISSDAIIKFDITSGTSAGRFDFQFGLTGASQALNIKNSTGFIMHKFAGDGSVTFNSLGSAVDFKVSGDTDVNLINADGSADRVGIGVLIPSEKLHVSGNILGTGTLKVTNEIIIGDQVGTANGSIYYDSTGGSEAFYGRVAGSWVDLSATSGGGGGGGSRFMIQGGTSGVGGGTTSTLSYGTNNANSGVVIPRDFEIDGIGISINNGLNSGSITAEWMVNNTVQSGTAVINTSTYLRAYSTFTAVGFQISNLVAGDKGGYEVEVRCTTSGFGPTGADATVIVMGNET